MESIRTSAVNSSDRLSFTLFLAAALHGLLIFGISLSASAPSESAPSVTVTIATHQSPEAPDEADFIAQENQIGSGTLDAVEEITTDKRSPLDSQTINDTDIADLKLANEPNEQQRESVVTSTEAKERLNQEAPALNRQSDSQGQDNQQLQLLAQNYASLAAKLDAQRQQYAKRPRERVLTSVSTKRSSDAVYLTDWAQKVERVGNENFPEAAIRDQITGSLRLETTIRADGSLIEANILQGSGHSVLDQAALSIIKLSAPFKPFTQEMRKDTDQIVIIRTWHFDINGLMTEQ